MAMKRLFAVAALIAVSGMGCGDNPVGPTSPKRRDGRWRGFQPRSGSRPAVGIQFDVSGGKVSSLMVTVEHLSPVGTPSCLLALTPEGNGPFDLSTNMFRADVRATSTPVPGVSNLPLATVIGDFTTAEVGGIFTSDSTASGGLTYVFAPRQFVMLCAGQDIWAPIDAFEKREISWTATKQ